MTTRKKSTKQKAPRKRGSSFYPVTYRRLMRDLEMAIRVVGEDDACVGIIPMWHHGAQVDPAFADADILALVWLGGGGRVDAVHTYLTPHNAKKVRCRLCPDGSREYRFTIRQPLIAESIRGTFSTKENFRLLLY